MKCLKCGYKISSKFKLCPNCGEIIKKTNNVKKEKTKKTSVNLKIILPIFVVSFLMILMIVIIIFKNNNANYDVDKLKSSVVMINVYDKENQLIATGSGVVAFDKNIILTNAHVIEDNYRLEVISENNTKYQVEGILDYNKRKDIAILKLVSSKGLKPVPIKEKIKNGDKVVAIGSPLGLKNTISDGILSGLYQDNIEVYQHTAPISPGSSGGALFDNNGSLVGITYASLEEGQNLNFAIPIKYYEREYNIVKNNEGINTSNYYLLNNYILKTNGGNKLLNYVLNDEYKNTLTPKSESEEDSKKGHINYEFGVLDNSSEVGKYIKSSMVITSGVINMLDGVSGTWDVIYGNYYTVILVKTTNEDKKNINKITKYINNDYDSSYNTDEGNYIINSKKNMIYALECRNYKKCSDVKLILEDIIKNN